MESIDIIWTYYIQVTRNSLHTFNPALSGDNSMFLSVFGYSALAYLVNSTEFLQKISYFIVFFLTNFFSFAVFYSQIKRREYGEFASYIGATIGSLIYTINSNIVPQFFHYSFLWGYMLLPLVFNFTIEIVNSKSMKVTLRNTFLLSLVFPFMADARAMFIGALVFVFLILWNLAYQRNKIQLLSYIKKITVSTVIVVLLSALISAFWLLTYLKVKPSAYWAITSTSTIVANSPSLFNIIVNVWYPQPFFVPSGIFASIWVAAIIIPAVALLSILKKPEDKIVQTLLVLSIISVFLGKGTSAPFGGFYLWLSSQFPKIICLQSLFDMILKYPSLFVIVVSLAYSLLCGLVIADVFGKVQGLVYVSVGDKPASTVALQSWKKILSHFGVHKLLRQKIYGAVLCILLVISAGVSSYPLITGNMNGSVTPTELPLQYKSMNNFLVNQTGDFRTIFFPQSAAVTWGSNFTNKPEYFAVSTPVLSYGWGTVPSTNMGFFGNLVHTYLIDNSSQNIGNLLSLANVRYIVFHNDTWDFAEHQSLYNNLLTQKDLDLVFNENNLFLFENNKDLQYVYALNSTILVVGGLDSLNALSEIMQNALNNYSWIFLEQFPFSFEHLDNFLKFSGEKTILLFYGDKDFTDLVLDTIGQKYYVAPFNILTETYPLTSWRKETSSDYYWSQVVLSQFQGGLKYDFDLNQGIVFTSTNDAAFNIPLVLNESATYETWVRILENPSGGKISVSVDDQKVGSTYSKTQTLNGFKWVNIGNITLTRGKHSLTVTNDNGFNAINVVSLIPQQDMDYYTSKISELLSSSNIKTVLISTGDRQNTGGVIEDSAKLPFVVNYTEINPTKYLVHVNATSPFMLVFSEPYNGLWCANTDGNWYSNIPISSMMNGFWINRTGVFSVTIEYSPEKYFVIGTVISILSIGAVMTCLVLTIDRVRWGLLKVLRRIQGRL
ncbi:hypothetical protein G4O51_00995 [Candidatus Bathyarchaeota archaeon A05DMB-2]|nr:hypothetical protein [Candidatus Bathyarchaeota archaeon A05DMB-2]